MTMAGMKRHRRESPRDLFVGILIVGALSVAVSCGLVWAISEIVEHFTP